MGDLITYTAFNTKRYYFLFVLLYVNLINIAYLFLFNLTDSKFFVTIFPVTKDLLIFSFFIYVLLNSFYSRKFVIKRRFVILYGIIVIYFSCLLLHLFISPAPFSLKIYLLRTLIIFFLTFLSFQLFTFRLEDISFIKKWLVILTYIICIFGIIEYFLSDFFWDEIIGMPKYVASRVLGFNSKVGSIADSGGRGYTSDLIFLTGDRVRRMMSFYAEPTTLGAYLTFVFSYFVFAENIRYKKILISLICFCGLLVFSKIFVLSIIVVFAFRFFIRSPKFYPLILGSGLLYLLGYFLQPLGKFHGAFSHLFGYYNGINLLADYKTGFGLGMAGNRGVLNHQINMGEYGGESGLGNVLAQIGIPGLLFVLVLIIIMKELKTLYRETNNNDYFAVFVALTSYFINFYLSFASLGLSGNIMFFMFAGIYLNSRLSGRYNRLNYGY